MVDGDNNSVDCYKYNAWFHWGCVGFYEDIDDWVCNDYNLAPFANYDSVL